MKSVLDEPCGAPSTTGLMPIEIEGASPCKCGHLMIPKRSDSVSWYWQSHGLRVCTLELPDLVCWCGLKRSEHIDGHELGEKGSRP